jgi:hypothetical protein
MKKYYYLMALVISTACASGPFIIMERSEKSVSLGHTIVKYEIHKRISFGKNRDYNPYRDYNSYGKNRDYICGEKENLKFETKQYFRNQIQKIIVCESKIRHNMERTKLTTEVMDIKKYLELMKERVETLEVKMEETCEDNKCQDATYEEPPEEINYYNSFEVTMESGKMSMAWQDCPMLPSPTTTKELKELGTMMTTNDIDKQPLAIMEYENYLMYPASKIFSGNLDVENETPATPDRNPNYYMLYIVDKTLKLKESNDTTEGKYLCLKDKTSIRYSEDKNKNKIKNMKYDLDKTKLLVTTWTHIITKCQPKDPNQAGGQEINLKSLPVVNTIRKAYYTLERIAHMPIKTGVLKTVCDQVQAIRQDMERYIQEAKMCQVNNCVIEVGVTRMIFICRQETMVRGTMIRGIPVPYHEKESTRILLYQHYEFDFGFSTCTVPMGESTKVRISLHPKCCEEIDKQTSTTRCPYTMVGNGPTYYEYGPRGYVTDSDNTVIDTQCGTHSESYHITKEDSILTDCAITVRKIGQLAGLKVPGFGIVLNKLIRFQEAAAKIWTPAELGLICLGTVVVLFILLYLLCCCPCVVDILLRCCCCQQRTINPTAPTDRMSPREMVLFICKGGNTED